VKNVAHILVVEDEPALLRGMTRALELLEGVRVTGCGTAEDAARTIAMDPPALLITDINLPGRFGLSLIGDLEAAGLAIPVVVVTAYRTIYEEQIPRHGRITVLEKPVPMETLHGLVKELLGDPEAEPVSPFSLTDYLQVAALGRHSVRLETVLLSGSKGIVDLEEGMLRHVELEGDRGLDALALLLGATLSSITVNSLPQALEETELELSVDKALLDLAVARDTGMAEPGTTDPESGEGSPEGEKDVASPFDAVFSRAVEASLARDYARALALFREALELRPGDGKVLHNIGRIEAILQRDDSRSGGE